MSITVKCPLCGMPLTAPDSAVGRMGRCKACTAIFEIQTVEPSPQVPSPTEPIIFCSKCGTPNPENNFKCFRCQTHLHHPDSCSTNPRSTTVRNHAKRLSIPQIQSEDIPSNLLTAIICACFCCLPLGIPAIIYATQVKDKIRNGDYEGAMRSSENAKFWSRISFYSGVIMLILLAFSGAFNRG